jgi:hypothetical protein
MPKNNSKVRESEDLIRKREDNLLLDYFLQIQDCLDSSSKRKRVYLIGKLNSLVSTLRDFSFDGQRARQVRLNAGLSLRGLEREIGVSDSYLAQLEREERIPHLSRKAVAIKRYFGWLGERGYNPF